MKTHYDEVFKCLKCPPIWKEGPENQFNTKKALVKHSFEKHESSHQKGVRYPCSQCEYKATNTDYDMMHAESMHKDINNSCKGCEYKIHIKHVLK